MWQPGIKISILTRTLTQNKYYVGDILLDILTRLTDFVCSLTISPWSDCVVRVIEQVWSPALHVIKMGHPPEWVHPA